jgi:hypothetical protein
VGGPHLVNVHAKKVPRKTRGEREKNSRKEEKKKKRLTKNWQKEDPSKV